MLLGAGWMRWMRCWRRVNGRCRPRPARPWQWPAAATGWRFPLALTCDGDEDQAPLHTSCHRHSHIVTASPMPLQTVQTAVTLCATRRAALAGCDADKGAKLGVRCQTGRGLNPPVISPVDIAARERAPAVNDPASYDVPTGSTD